MGRDHLGKPSGANRVEGGTGVPSKTTPENIPENEEMTNKYTNDDNEVKEGTRTMNPNRNTDKDDATNAGGYRN